MNQAEIISVGLSKDSPSRGPNGDVSIPLVVESGKQYTVLHGLGKVPRGIFVSMADQYVRVAVVWRNPTHCLVSFDASANLILRVE